MVDALVRPTILIGPALCTTLLIGPALVCTTLLIGRAIVRPTLLIGPALCTTLLIGPALVRTTLPIGRGDRSRRFRLVGAFVLSLPREVRHANARRKKTITRKASSCGDN